ncbi:cytochrome P450 [Streptomyces atratus]|uniref:Cytochrome P450 n=1 Tax=Streptomyces atratus TaxID=1893 RepID=A0A2Z5JHJ6_STRAR|nr:cytochrome P450 [Streptomyces atratus]AXE79828.1 cytochrome P450 [Streptomyces atratus]QBG38788.1 Atr27 [Streptomyces atratus]
MTSATATALGGADVEDRELDSFDLTDPMTYQTTDVHAMWRRFRTERPVHRHPATAAGPEFWVLSKYDDIMKLYKDDGNFTSERGNVLVTLLHGSDSAAGKMLAVTDGPRHAAIRKLMLKSFSPRSLQHISEQVVQRTRALLKDAVERGEADFARDVAEHIPIATICDLLGVPESDRGFLLGLNKQALSSSTADTSAEDSWLARNEILLYFAELAEERRRNPVDDVISVLATGRIDGEPLGEDEIVLNCYSLILGGDETSRLSMIGGVQALMRHPEQWNALKQGEATVESAVEEVVRWTTPGMHFGRRALRDVEVAGQRIAAGDIVTLWNTSANRDEDIFDAPETFDLARTPNKHVSFGYGPHFCLGAFLGRVEINAMLDAVRTVVDRIEPNGPVEPVFSNFLSGLESLPVRFEADREGLARWS